MLLREEGRWRDDSKGGDAHRARLREHSLHLVTEARADERHRLSSLYHHDSLTTCLADLLPTRR